MLRSPYHRQRDASRRDARAASRTAADLSAAIALDAGIDVGFSDNERRCKSGSGDWTPCGLTDWTYTDEPFYTCD